MIPEFTHLKAVIEGQPRLPRWKQWFDAHAGALEGFLSPGQMLRLRYYPTKEIPKILSEVAIQFVQSDFYEWLDSDSASGRCRECGTTLQRRGGPGGGSVWCPQGCTSMHWDCKPPRKQNAEA